MKAQLDQHACTPTRNISSVYFYKPNISLLLVCYVTSKDSTLNNLGRYLEFYSSMLDDTTKFLHSRLRPTSQCCVCSAEDHASNYNIAGIRPHKVIKYHWPLIVHCYY